MRARAGLHGDRVHRQVQCRAGTTGLVDLDDDVLHRRGEAVNPDERDAPGRAQSQETRRAVERSRRLDQRQRERRVGNREPEAVRAEEGGDAAGADRQDARAGRGVAGGVRDVGRAAGDERELTGQ